MQHTQGLISRLYTRVSPALTDDNGVWKQTKTATTALHIDFFKNGRVSSVQSCPSTATAKKKCYTLVSRHYYCKSSPDLTRHLSMLLDPRGQAKPNQYVRYRFSGLEHSVNVQPHGNSKKTIRPYKRTCPSTLQDLQEELKHHPPKRAIFKVDQKRGGISNISCVGDLPRNMLQATRIKNKCSSPSIPTSSDPLQSLVVKFKQQHGNPNQFVQCIRLAPDPAVVLFNQIQLDDLSQFCGSSNRASVLGVDVTFNLGKFYVTLCTYQNFKVTNEKGKHPIMVGPALIHSLKDRSNFAILFQEMTSKKPLLATTLRAYGTDGEQALVQAAAGAFPFATHLRCANHLKDNITDHLRKQLLPENVVKEIIYDIFGTSTERGLIHASNKDFDGKLLLLQRRWDELEKIYKPNPCVFTWFTGNMVSVIRENMRSELLEDLQLEEEKYTQNKSESLNALVKRYVTFQKQDILQFVNDLEECVHEQQNEISKSTIGLGRWSLSPYYSHVRQDASSWLKSVDKPDRLSSLRIASPLDQSSSREIVTPSALHQSTSREIVTPSALHQSTSGETDGDVDYDKCLSVPYTSLVHSLSEGLAMAIWKKAFQLLRDKKVIRAPDSTPTTRWVASDTQLSPHVVTTLKANPHRYICDKYCVGWKVHNICAHSVAAAEDNNELKMFLAWYTMSKGKKSNLTEAVYHNTYQHAGLKKPRRNRKYGDATHLPTEQKTDRLALNDISNSTGNSTSIQLPGGFSKDIPEQNTDAIPTLHAIQNKQPQLISGNGVGSGNNIQVCSTAHNVSFSESQPQVTTAAINTPLASVLSQLLVHSLTSRPATSGASLQSLFQPLTSPGPTESCTPETPSSNMSFAIKPSNTKSTHPFFLTLLTNRIKKCSGCHALFRDDHGQAPTFILGHKERDWYLQSGQWNLGKLQNKYYHLSRNCILSRCALYMFPEDFSTLQLAMHSVQEVPLAIKETIRKEFGVEV